MMRSRKCNLELQLHLFTDSDHRHMEEESSSRSPVDHQQQQHHQERQKLTIFYNGRVCVCDVTELQARAILSTATREMEETMKTPTCSSTLLSSSQLSTSSSNLSMKRSLQRFLQKRKRNRIQSTSPYIVN
ncbi:protein TIFY 5A-like [Tripterygium wilfordii]|uniref:protein TIFY 5A-like n=1 Tax=Tripterygium wilfordii TaxID=458696 RepID=UPI0018F80FF1|nr:protein TIFY 5A-like [Tripterygium wilfordii]